MTGMVTPIFWIEALTWALIVAAVLILIRIANVFRYIPNNQVGIVEKMYGPV